MELLTYDGDGGDGDDGDDGDDHDVMATMIKFVVHGHRDVENNNNVDSSIC